MKVEMYKFRSLLSILFLLFSIILENSDSNLRRAGIFASHVLSGNEEKPNNRKDTTMGARFFNPWVGDDYWDGMGGNEYCVLVLGASAYCSSRNCPHFDECTSEDNQDSSAFNDQCPHAEIDSDGQATLLEDYPSYCYSHTVDLFAENMEKQFGDMLDGGSIWDHVAFTEYVQYFIDQTYTEPNHLSDRDFDAFLETLDELHPDVVIVWGKLVADTLRNCQYTVDADDDQPWDFAWEYEDMFIRFICCTHPSSRRYFSQNFPYFAQQFEDTVCGDDDGDDDYEGGDEEGDEDWDGEDVDGEDWDDDNEGDEDWDDNGDGEYGDDNGDDEEEEGDDDGDVNNPASNIVLGLIMGNAFEQWKNGR
jgi:hypothetical protein